MSQTTKIAAVRIAGGETAPFYAAKLRVFYWDVGKHSDSIVKDVGGLRVLLADADATTVEHGGTDNVHLPLMLRGYVRPQDHPEEKPNPGLELRLRGKTKDVAGTLVAAKALNDVMLTPIGGWPHVLGGGIDVPELRLTAGVVPIALAVDTQPLVKFLKLATKSGVSTLFGGLRLDTAATKTIPLTLVPNGIELDGSLPDPTRDLLESEDTNARITGRFRLESGTDRDGKICYWLRLVGSTSKSPPGAMEQLEARIAAAFADLSTEKDAPLAVRFDRRPTVPPLLWPLNLTTTLALQESATGDFVMAIDASAIDARIRTVSRFPGDRPGIAAVHGEHLFWEKRKDDGFDVKIEAGAGSVGAPHVEIDLEREKADENEPAEWTSHLKNSFAKQDVEIPLDAVAARLLAIYKSGRVIAAAEAQPPYAFLPTADGWLQLGLARARKELTKPAEPKPLLSAMSGRIVAAHGNSADGLRGIVIDDAAAVLLTMRWRMQKGKCQPAGGALDIGGARGQLRGFAFVAETAPTAAEALPDLRRGPAATRDLPIAFNAPQSGLVLRGRFDWRPDGWSLEATNLFEVVPADTKIEPDPLKDGKLRGYGWKVPHPRPFITNHPLTRTAVTPAEPSVSRGLLRYAFQGVFTLESAAAGDAPKFIVEQPPSSWSDESVAPATESFAADTLVLTTLPGPEFTPLGWPKSQGAFKAALRHDLAILDELYAWSDPPPPKPGSGAPNVVSKHEAVTVTALDPQKLEDVWSQNRARMALTRTQRAFMTGWVDTDAAHGVAITSLVQPYSWTDVHLKIDLTPRWGAYELADRTYALESALTGLRQDFDIAGTELKPKPGAAIAVRGNAASLFKRKGSELVWDSRGTGLAAAVANGRRAVAFDDSAPDDRSWHGELRTLDKALSIEIDAKDETNPKPFPWMAGRRLAFYVRDLPVEKDEQSEKIVFDGDANPVEGASGTVGQAFDHANLARSVHEWRLLEEAPLAGTPSKVPPKPFDLSFGPFLFTPSRLRGVELDVAGEINKIAVIGGLRIAARKKADASREAEQAPFGADRIYQRADLFCLTLARNGATWTPTWTGVAVERTSGEQSTFKFASRAPEIRSAVSLAVAADSIASAEGALVEATISLDIASHKVRFGARLFGRTCEFKTAATIGTEISFAFEAAKSAAAKSPVLLRIDKISVTLSSDVQSIGIDGAVLVMPEATDTPDDPKKPDADAALVRFGREGASFRWLDLTGGGLAKRFSLSIDHASGRVSASLDGEWTQAKPLFGLDAASWSVCARLEAFFADPAPLQALAPLAAGAAWARLGGVVSGKSKRIDHRLLFDAERSDHHLDLTWECPFTSRVRWPVNGLRQSDGAALPPDWRQPAKADSANGRSRKIRIDAGETLEHGVKARFARHRIEARQLQRVGSRVTPRGPITLLAQVEHTLKGGDRTATFTTLDHVAITSLRLMSEMAANHAFAARYPGRLYRGQSTQAQAPHPGIVQLPWAVSGFFDEALVRFYGTKDLAPHLDTPLLLGGSAALFPYRLTEKQADAEKQAVSADVASAAPDEQAVALQDRALTTRERAVAAVIPWIGLEGEVTSVFKYLDQAGGQWHVSAPDLWGGSPFVGPVSQRTIIVTAGADADQMQSGLVGADLVPRDAGTTLARVLPVEQLFFENLHKGGQIEIGEGAKNDIPTAPFFLRTLLAIEARWNAMPADAKTSQWRALSLHPARGELGGTRADPVVATEIKTSPTPALDTLMPVPADLIALSARRAERQVAYRLIQADLADDIDGLKPYAELIARARDLDRFAECAIREVDRDGAVPAIVIVPIPAPRIVAGGRGGIAIVHPVLPPSPALGWPSEEGTTGLDMLAPRLGAELPVQSAAGFAARFRQIGLPGHAPEAMTYFAFSHRVAFERDLRVPFDGPAARHLSPVNTRLRAPTDKAIDPREDAEKISQPILPPFFELATIGRRPGVFEVVTAAVNVVAENKEFDPEHPRFGRPANSGPVVAHQLRTPRSPALPDDAADLVAAGRESDVLNVRRRTFLSLADGHRAGSQAIFTLDKFGMFGVSADVIRHDKNGNHLRVVASMTAAPGLLEAPSGLVGPDWDGLLAVKFDAAAMAPDEWGRLKETQSVVDLTDLLSAAKARLEIGMASFAMHHETSAIAWPSSVWTLSASQLLPAIRDELRRASVDVPIRLVITFETEGALAPAPRAKAILPLALDPGDRRVLRTGVRTIAFGDPSYDRQLGSTTESDIKQYGDVRGLLAVDRQEYDTGATLYFACDTIDSATGLFTGRSAGEKFTVRFRRLGKPNPDGSTRAPEKLVVAGRNPDVNANGDNGYDLDRSKPHEVQLRLLRLLRSDTADVSPLEPGDRLEVSADMIVGTEKKTLAVFVNIVATPVIAPPPCVYSVIESTGGETDVSRVVLHAAAPLPQHVELPQLREGLAKGLVRRRALFVWRFARLGAGEGEIELVKYDRSGGAQLPGKT